jgi:mannose-6-phosphate isomerase-like protein (cupin superfamily)
MLIIRHEDSPWLSWREGVQTRVWTSALMGALSAHTGEQVLAPGSKVPVHWHYYEEHITIYRGIAAITVDHETIEIEGPASVVAPGRSHHGFHNVGDSDLHIIGAVPWPIHETLFVDDPEGVVTRGWEPGFAELRRRMEAVRGPAT